MPNAARPADAPDTYATPWLPAASTSIRIPSTQKYGPYLELQGFKQVDPGNYAPRAGDIIVIQNYDAGLDRSGQPYPAGDAAGHNAMFDGAQWVSDFKQRDMWAGPGYRAARPNAMICRP